MANIKDKMTQDIFDKIIKEILDNMVEVIVDEKCLAYTETKKNVPKENFKFPKSKKFFISRYAVTQEQWEAVMNKENPSEFKGENLPVECVSWTDAQEFIKKLNDKPERTNKPDKEYRLPTEAEWEYAARGGKKSNNYEYAGTSDNNKKVAWHYENSGDRELEDNKRDAKNLDANKNKTHDVGLKLPNELGLYDMSGNVWEWCEDWYDKDHAYRVLRGGSWCSSAERCRVSYRYYFRSPDPRITFIGFRLVLPQL
ncbi:MAG: formylglycine-generating enzyme family protein [Dysgonamonadaceae bacterium]|jgi:formylglycine-generating enzyme required for sulfatase activity|nr:formylglycine-generating enzyme family protein [Dysgonamonadaceae bacterium]